MSEDVFYDPKKVFNPPVREGYEPENTHLDYLEETEQLINIGQSYSKKKAAILKCKFCGTTTFTVAQGDCFTAVKCNTCEYEVCIHDG